MNDEATYFSDASVKVTNNCIRLGGKTYQVSDVTSVRMRTSQADPLRDLPTFLVIAGSILMFAILNLQNVLPGSWDDLVRLATIGGMLLSVAGLVLLVMGMFLKVEYLYVVHLNGVFGGACPFASDDEAYVRSIVQAIQQAVNERPSTVMLERRSLVETTR